MSVTVGNVVVLDGKGDRPEEQRQWAEEGVLSPLVVGIARTADVPKSGGGEHARREEVLDHPVGL